MFNIARLLGFQRREPGQIGPRQRELLQQLLEQKEGCTVDELVKALGVTRSAVHQHLAALERDGFVEKRSLAKTRGRPGQVYALTRDGIHLFPKQYDWFSTFLMEVLARRLGDEELAAELRRIGEGLADSVSAELEAKDFDGRLDAVARLMTKLGYVAKTGNGEPPGAVAEIQAFNCIYHHLAEERPEVCELDLALLERLTGARPEHVECLARGGASCRFRFERPVAGEKEAGPAA